MSRDLATIKDYVPVGLVGLEDDMNWLHLAAFKCYAELSECRDAFSMHGRHKRRIAVQELQRDIKDSFFGSNLSGIYTDIVAAIAAGIRHVQTCRADAGI